MSDQTDTATVAELAKDIRIAMFTSLDGDGHLTARPMAQQEVEFDGDLWFFVEADSRTAANIGANPKTGVTLSSNSTWISLSGTSTVVRDVEKATQLWNAWVEGLVARRSGGSQCRADQIQRRYG